MKDTTQDCIICERHPLIGGSRATFSASGQLLFADIPLGSELPEEFDVSMDGDTFTVVIHEGGHCICEDDRDAFTSQVYG